MNEGIGEADALAVAFGERADDFSFDVAEVTEFENIADGLADFSTGDSFEAGAIAEVFADAHIGVEGGIFGEIAEVFPGF